MQQLQLGASPPLTRLNDSANAAQLSQQWPDFSLCQFRMEKMAILLDCPLCWLRTAPNSKVRPFSAVLFSIKF